jgi:FecR protein/Putative zinc-finger
MKHLENNQREVMGLDDAIAALRADQPAADAAQSAAERVWKSLSTAAVTGVADAESIRGCSGVRSLLVQYRAGELSPERRLLVSAHLNECVHCRRLAEGHGNAAIAPWKQELRPTGYPAFRWAVAAVAVIALALSGYFLSNKFFAGPAGMRARVESFDGALFRVGFNGEQPLKVGDELDEGELVRTGGGSHAMLRLRDGSRVEMNERAQFGVSMSRNDTTVQLDRGDIIVQAAKRKTGHLYVTASDVKVSVTGTVFSVNHGIKGSRVSVIEGEVRVGGTGADGLFHNAVLHPGEQMSTDAAGPVPVKQEIAWSRNVDKHLALLAEFAHLQNKLEAVQLPGLRYQSKLLPLLPGNTLVVASIPNLGDAVQQANQLFQQELQASSVLREWWQQSQSHSKHPDYDQVIDEIHQLSQYLGDEIVFSLATDGHQASPMVVAEVRQPGLKAFIEQELARHSGTPDHPGVQVLDEAGLASAVSATRGSSLFMLVRPDFVAASVDLGALKQFNQNANQNSANFSATPFGQRILAAYPQGVGLLFGADLASMQVVHNANHPTRHRPEFANTGLADVQYLIAERKEVSGEPLNHAELSFTGQRHGLASWLAAPAPIGGLEFVSKDASAAAAFVAKTPAQMLDDILSIAGTTGQVNLAKGESELKIQFHQDLADTLGGELTLALDGPILPTPSWKIIAEVYNPGRLQATIQQLVNDVNDRVRQSQNRIVAEQETVNGLTYYRLRSAGKPAEMDYTFTNGYMILAPSRALVMNAVQVHQNGNSLARSNDFHALLPQDAHTNVSALLYQNLAPVVGPVMSQLSPAQLQAFQQLAAESKPSVVCAYGEPNSIRVASNSRLFGLDLNSMALSTLLRLTQPPGTR